MIKEYVVNLSLLVSILFIASQLLTHRWFHGLAKKHLPLIHGFGLGITGIILMLYSIHVNKHTILDLRYVMVILAALYGGWMSVWLTTLILIAARVTLFPVSPATWEGVISLLVVAVGCGLIGKLKTSVGVRAFWMTLYALTAATAILGLNRHNWAIIHATYLYFWPMTIIGAWFAVTIAEHLIRSTHLRAQFEKMATTDHLTNLDNVRRFDEVLNHQMIAAATEGYPLSLLLIDVDHFKRINDTYGHPGGDCILKQLADILKQCSRDNDNVSRNGGEEFAYILPRCTPDDAIALADRLRHTVEQEAFELPDGRTIPITISIGVSSFPDPSIDSTQLLHDADEGL